MWKVHMWPPTQETNHVYIPETQACACMQHMQIVKPCIENLFLMVCFPYPIITISCRTKRLTMKVVLSCQILKQAQEKKILHKKLINKVISYAQANEKVRDRKTNSIIGILLKSSKLIRKGNMDRWWSRNESSFSWVCLNNMW